MASLVVQLENGPVKYNIEPGSNLIGRHPDCAIDILQPSVSGRHAIIHLENDEHFVEDIGSRNGTYLNQERVTQRTKLKHHDHLQFGDASARFESPENVAESHFVQSAAPATQLGLTGTVKVEDQPATVTSEVRGDRFAGLDVNPEAKLKAVLEISNRLAGTLDSFVCLRK